MRLCGSLRHSCCAEETDGSVRSRRGCPKIEHGNGLTARRRRQGVVKADGRSIPIYRVHGNIFVILCAKGRLPSDHYFLPPPFFFPFPFLSMLNFSGTADPFAISLLLKVNTPPLNRPTPIPRPRSSVFDRLSRSFSCRFLAAKLNPRSFPLPPISPSPPDPLTHDPAACASLRAFSDLRSCAFRILLRIFVG
jgi:hypothetical protein